jgi:hypothetical protein
MQDKKGPDGRNVEEADLDLVYYERSSVLSMNKHDEYFEVKEDESTSSPQEIEFNLEYGRELVRLYTKICDSQNPIQSFILENMSDLVNEANIILFIEFGLRNEYIKKNPKLTPIKKVISKRNRGRLNLKIQI